MSSDKIDNASQETPDNKALSDFTAGIYQGDSKRLLIAQAPGQTSVPPSDIQQMPQCGPRTNFPPGTLQPGYLPGQPGNSSYYVPRPGYCPGEVRPQPELRRPGDIGRMYVPLENAVVQATLTVAALINNENLLQKNPSKSRIDPNACFLNAILQNKAIGRRSYGDTVAEIDHNLSLPENNFCHLPINVVKPGDIIIAYPNYPAGAPPIAAVCITPDLAAMYDSATKRVSTSCRISDFCPPRPDNPIPPIYRQASIYRWPGW